MTKKYKHYIVTHKGKKLWFSRDMFTGLPCTTDDEAYAELFTIDKPIPTDNLCYYIDPDACKEYKVVSVAETKVKDKYKEQLDRIEQKVDALLNAEINKMPKVNPSPFVPTNNTCSRCGISFDKITNYSCQDPYCATFMRITSSVMPLDPDKRDWEYDGYGIKRPKGEID